MKKKVGGDLKTSKVGLLESLHVHLHQSVT